MSATNPRDLDFMHAALSLARRGLGNTYPNPAVGCILVKDGPDGVYVVSRGWTQPGGRPHAEAMALSGAGEAAAGCTAYVTLEPCAHEGVTPPCADALVQAGVKRVVVAIGDPDPRVSGKGLKILKNSGVEVVENVARGEAWQTNLGFFLSRTLNRPMFTLKLATDQNGFIPGQNAQGADKWVTSGAARDRGHLLRANHDAVLFGIGTVLADDPAYTCRLAGLEGQSPVRVLLDSRLRLPKDAQLLATVGQAPLWIICGAKAERPEDFERQGVTIIQAPTATPEPLWIAEALVERGLTRVLIESGPSVVTAFLEAGLVDEMAWFRAAKVLGAGCVPAFHGKSMEILAFERQAVLQAGPDQLELYRLKA